MLTKLEIRNFKRFGGVAVELGNPVVFVGPNNSGKTTALQALALWDLGLRRWRARRQGSAADERTGVAINRRDVAAVPVPSARHFWQGLRVRRGHRVGDKTRTENIRIEIIVTGVDDGVEWRVGLEYDYANEESIYVRPIPDRAGLTDPLTTPPGTLEVRRVAFLPPMSGLAANEVRLQPGAIDTRLGEGRSAEVLRNLCFDVAERSDQSRSGEWTALVARVKELFGVELGRPTYLPERGEIEMAYRDRGGVQLDLSAAGRGQQQVILLLAHLYRNSRAVLLLDEPDAHLEIVRQRQIYSVLTDVALETGSQLLIATHSEIVLNTAGERDVVVAFLGRPHRVDDRGTQLRKSLAEIGFDQYYQAEQKGWVLYLEGSTDLAILLSFAQQLGHPAADHLLASPFLVTVGNHRAKAEDHFFGLREACPGLVGFVLLDRDPSDQSSAGERSPLRIRRWRAREIENYLCRRDALLAWAEDAGTRQVGNVVSEQSNLFGVEWRSTMAEEIDRLEAALKVARRDPWSHDTKVSDDFFAPLFENFYGHLKLPNLMLKSNYHRLAPFVPSDAIDSEVVDVLDNIVAIASLARPADDVEEPQQS